MEHPLSSPPTPSPRWAIVTGGSIRGGLAISRHLHERGLGVVVHHAGASSAERAQAVVDELNGRRPGSAMRWQAALEDHPAFPQSDLDVAVVVCNASRLAASHCEDLDDALLDFRVHVSGHAALLASVAPSLKRLRGSVVAVGDLQTQQPNRDYVWYLVAKAGLETLVRSLAVEWAPQVRCNVVAPGAMDWHEGWTDEARRDAIMNSIPQQRIGTFDELAECITWLALDATYVNGQVLKMDGGRSIWLK
jgi:pteridine reductase